MRRILLTLACAAWVPLTANVASASVADPGTGSYVSSRLNGKPLPVSDLATDDKGVQFLIEFDELVLTIRPNHEFRAALRYRQTLAAKGDRIGRDPIQKMTVYGTYATTGNAIRFVPDPKRGGQGLRILDGTFAGRSIDVPFDYRNGSVQRRAQVSLVLNPNIF
ncbi:MAG: hypothetical protein HY084_01995 [Gemmatimonadetes bacterium]|nr:hypothetical protein [Gemmatimonadota bacterium]